MTLDTKLIPCPFCRCSTPVPTMDEATGGYVSVVVCWYCKCEGPPARHTDKDEVARMARDGWNCRATEEMTNRPGRNDEQ